MDKQPSSGAISPLDQLEAQVNLVLEHTGRVFAGTARSQKHNGLVNANNSARLTNVFSGAIDDFHNALDVLEEELAIARAVMRRDLAVCRRASRAQMLDAQDNEQILSNGANEPFQTEMQSAEVVQDTDVTMTGDSPQPLEHSPPQQASDPEILEKEAQDQPQEQASEQSQPSQQRQAPLEIEIPTGEHSGDNQTDVATGTYSNFDFESLFNDPSAHPSPEVVQIAEQTKTESQPEQPPAESTASERPEAQTTNSAQDATATSTSQNNDTAQTSNEGTNNENNNDTTDTFDFGDLTNFGDGGEGGNDDDNISSLLPGLESYANETPTTNPAQPTQSQAPVDNNFNIFNSAAGSDFGTLNTEDKNADGQKQQQASIGGGEDNNSKPDENQHQNQTQDQNNGIGNAEEEEQRDDTFDALMNFDNFDMGSFGGDDGDGEGGGNTTFDASFFDI